MADDEQQPHGRLGRLFAALVGTGIADATVEPAADDDGARPVLDLDQLSVRLASSADPMGVLRALVADVRRRSGLGGEAAPTGLELFLAERLEEAGVSDKDVELPAVRVVRPRTSDLFYLRIEETELPWASTLAVLGIEAALNETLLAERALDDAEDAPLEEVVRCEQRVARSVAAQVPSVAERAGGPVFGEWAVREAISFGIESLRLPHRLTARFRVNVRRGAAALEVDLTLPRTWAATAYVDGLGVVPATAQMRRRAATDYNLRLGVLLAGYALAVAPELDAVWVAGVVDDPTGHACYYSARLERALMETVDLTGRFDPLALMREAGATIDAANGELAPVRQGFSLDDELFCPSARFEAVETSDESLPLSAAEALGCRLVRELGSDEAAARRAASAGLARGLGETTADDVRALLCVADAPGATGDVREAALRCVRALVDGTLDADPLTVLEAFVDGGALREAVGRARELLLSGRADEARSALEGALAAADAAYLDDDRRVWRSFSTHAERVLHNLLGDEGGREVALVPDAYLEAHLLLSACALAQGRADDATAHARRAAELAPASAQASLNLAQCLEAAGDADGAADELRRALGLACDPESLGMAYLRMSQLQWHAGHVLVAQACYQRAARHLGGPALMAGLAVAALLGQVGVASDGSLTPEQADAARVGADIPLAPTQRVVGALLGAAQAAVDIERFDVARDVTRALCSAVRDDVTFGVLRSLEDEPDR